MELPVIRKDVRCYWQSKSLSSVQVKKSIKAYTIEVDNVKLDKTYPSIVHALIYDRKRKEICL